MTTKPFIGGDLAPKNHFCSGRYLLEGCVKGRRENGVPYVYLIAACREGRDSETREPDNTYTVTFKPFFSGTWAATNVEVVGESRSVPVDNGTFTDTFHGEWVHVYKFEKPGVFGNP